MTIRRLAIIFFSLLAVFSGLVIVYKIVDDDALSRSINIQEKQYKIILSHYGQKEYENTIRLGETFLNSFPDGPYSADVMLNVGQSYFQLKDYDNAIKTYNSLLEKYPDHKLKNYVKDKIAQATDYKGDFVSSLEIGKQGAQIDFEKCKELFDDNLYKYALGAFITYRGKYPESPFSSNVDFLIADCYFNLGDFDSAVKLFQQVVEKYPQSEDKYLAQRRLERIATLQEKKESNSLQDIYNRALNEYNQKNYNSAISEFSDFLALYPTSKFAPNCQYWLAESYYSKDNKAAALQEFKKVVKNYPNSDKAKDAQIKIDMILNAKKSFNRSDEFTEYKNVRKYYLVGKYDKAITEFDEYILAYPDGKYMPNAYYWKGECYYSKGDYRKAIEVFEKVLQLFPDSQKANHSRIKISMAKEKLGIVEHTPQEILYQKSFALYKDRKYIEAIASFESFIDKYPVNPLVENCLYWIGECYYALGKYEEAKSHFSQVLTRYPSGNKYNDATIKLKMCQEKTGDKIKSEQEVLAESIYNDFQETNYARVVSRGVEFLEKYKNSPQSQKIHLLVAQSYEKSRKFDEAFREYKSIIGDYPEKALEIQEKILDLCSTLNRPLQLKIEELEMKKLKGEAGNE